MAMPLELLVANYKYIYFILLYKYVSQYRYLGGFVVVVVVEILAKRYFPSFGWFVVFCLLSNIVSL